MFTTPPLDRVPSQVALRTKLGGATHLGDKLLAAVLGTEVRIWSCSPTPRELSECVGHHGNQASIRTHCCRLP